MERRTFLTGAAAFGAGLATRSVPWPAAEAIPVAFLIGDHVNVIDLAGSWEVFQDVMVGAGHGEGFAPFTVAPSTAPVTGTAGLTFVPHYDLAHAPSARVVVVPAHHAPAESLEWLKRASRSADLVMSVCTGAFVLARAGLLDGLTATTHHEFQDALARDFPRVKVERGVRYIEHDHVATAAGLTSGIDLALRVVERYYGGDQARATATHLEYQSRA
ncbi:MAG TPA: DJ-1/PfpI family protein [Gemmatimonadales bacterium]